MKFSKLETIVIIFLVVILILSVIIAPKGSYINNNMVSANEPEEITPPEEEYIITDDTGEAVKENEAPEKHAQTESSSENIDSQVHLPMIPAEVRSAEFNGRVYYDTGVISEAVRCGVMDGNISVSGTEYGYQVSGENTIDVLIDGNWCIFEAEDMWGLTLTAENVKNTGLTYVFTHSGGNPKGSLEYGSDYSIEKLIDGEWIAVEFLPQEYDIAWTSEAHLISTDSETRNEIDWRWLYGELDKGTYRFSKSVMDFVETGVYETKIYYVEFDIA